MRILFVCLGNICRSPTVEAVARTLAAREAPHLTLEFDSAGTAGYHSGDPPDERSQRHGAQHGYDLSALRARQLARADFERFDLLLAMDDDNLGAMHRIAPAERQARARLFLSYLPVESASESVPDPYYGGPADFERVIELAERGVRALFVAIAAERGVLVNNR
jgi:protein-tyrosine phosphatase